MAKNNAELETLVRRSVQGDKDAFERLCRMEAQPIIYYCIKVLGNRQDGEDAAQEVFIQMQQSIHSLKAPEAFVSWVRKLTLNVCGKMRRKCAV